MFPTDLATLQAILVVLQKSLHTGDADTPPYTSVDRLLEALNIGLIATIQEQIQEMVVEQTPPIPPVVRS